MDSEPPFTLGSTHIAAGSGSSVSSVRSNSGGHGGYPLHGGNSVASSGSATGANNISSNNNVRMVQSLQNEQAVVRKAGRQAIRQFLDSHTCFAVLRTSGKVVVFDIRIPIQLAFYALVEHDILAAPLWDPVKCHFVGLLTVTDFIDILRFYRSSQKDVSQLAVCSIAEILSLSFDNDDLKQQKEHGQSPGVVGSDSVTVGLVGITHLAGDGGSSSVESSSVATHHTTTGTTDATAGSAGASTTAAVVAGPVPPLSSTRSKVSMPVTRSFRGADSSCTLRQACELLLTFDHQDYLPIVFAEDMRVLACITFTTILEHLVTHFREQRRLFDDSIIDLQIGTYNNVISVFPHQTLADALELMYQYKLSALPVVEATADGRRKLIGVYSRSDITFLTKAVDAEDAVRNLNMPVGEILVQSRMDVTTPDALRTCSPAHTLQAIFESFAQLRFNRLYVVDPNDDTLIGTVSARDLVAYFIRTDGVNSNTMMDEQ